MFLFIFIYYTIIYINKDYTLFYMDNLLNSKLDSLAELNINENDKFNYSIYFFSNTINLDINFEVNSINYFKKPFLPYMLLVDKCIVTSQVTNIVYDINNIDIDDILYPIFIGVVVLEIIYTVIDEYELLAIL